MAKQIQETQQAIAWEVRATQRVFSWMELSSAALPAPLEAVKALGETCQTAPKDSARGSDPSPARASLTLSELKQLVAALFEGALSVEAFRSGYFRLVASRDAILQELCLSHPALKLRILAAALGDYSARTSTKLENASSIFRSLLLLFALGEPLRFPPFSDSLEAAVSLVVRRATAEMLTRFARERDSQPNKLEAPFRAWLLEKDVPNASRQKSAAPGRKTARNSSQLSGRDPSVGSS
jgi:hypothetical protein